jgi:hypothetical protein
MKIKVKDEIVEIDRKDLDLINKHNWWIVEYPKVKYAVTKIKGYRIPMHRMILGLKKGDGKITDHKDGNGLNNKRSNIKVVTHTVNMRNKQKSKANTSGKIGVYYREQKQNDNHYSKWIAAIFMDGKLKTKSYLVQKYGNKTARNLACKWRNNMEHKLNIKTRNNPEYIGLKEVYSG